MDSRAGAVQKPENGGGMRIQIVEDDRALGEGIALALEEPGTEFIKNAEVRAAREDFQRQEPDVIILDLNLPDENGFAYLKWVRSRSCVPVLILTANDLELDEVKGFTLGADDYMTKPFSLAVLRARIRNLTRRAGQAFVYEIDDYVFDFHRLVFSRKGREISLSRNEQKLLRLLVENRGRILTREVLMDRLWTDGAEYVDENALSVTVNRLRSKLEEKGSSGYIRTIYGQGYIWGKEERKK